MGKFNYKSISLILTLWGFPLYAQSDWLRKEWSNFGGYNGQPHPSALADIEASTASNTRLENRVIESGLGNSRYVAHRAGAGFWAYFTPYYQGTIDGFIGYGATANVGWQLINASSASYLDYNVGLASFSASNTIVGGTSNPDWIRHILAGDFIKEDNDGDFCWTEISTVNNATNITLTENYRCASAGTQTNYGIRKTINQVGSPVYGLGSGLLGSYAVLLASHSRRAQIWDNSNLSTNSSIPGCVFAEVHKRRVFCAGKYTDNDEDDIFWSPVNNPSATWNGASTESIFPQDGAGGIVAIKSYRTLLLVFKRYGKIYKVVGNFGTSVGSPDFILDVPGGKDLGQIAPRSVVEWNGLIYFLTTNGMYITDGDTVKLHNRFFEKEIFAVRSFFTPELQINVFCGVSNNNSLWCNLNDRVLIIDSTGKASIRTSLQDTYVSNFVLKGSDFYTALENSSYTVTLETGFTTTNGAGVTANVNLNSASNQDF